MSNYRELAQDIGSGGAEQGDSFAAGGGSQSLPAARNHNGLAVNIEPRIYGHDELFDPPVQSDYECPICLMCLCDPVQTACGHRFCKSCIQCNMRINGPKCPCDNLQLEPSEIFDDNFAKREINQFTVKCHTVKNGKECPWKGELQRLEIFDDNFAKREINQFTVKCRTVKSGKECLWIGELQRLENHLATCEFVGVSCTEGCGQTVERRALDNHVKQECPRRTVRCFHCKSDLQHRNYKDHLKRCPKVYVVCPQCSEEMFRDKLINHDRKCPNGLESCKFKDRGCKWVGLRSVLTTHLETDHHPSDGRKKSISNRKAAKNEECANQMKENSKKIEQDFLPMIARGIAGAAATTNNIAELETRSCNGIFLWRINGYPRHVENARQGWSYAVNSPPFHRASGKVCLRLVVNPNGVSLFVHTMQSKWEDILVGPFAGYISLTILDQSDDGEYKRHFSKTLVTRPNVLAFQRPTTPCNHQGYGDVEFAHLETLQERQFVKNDCLLVGVQVYK